jgi:hypothetical protein
LYVNSHYTQKYYEFAVVSSKNVCQTRLTPTLRHKEQFPYQSLAPPMARADGDAGHEATKEPESV